MIDEPQNANTRVLDMVPIISRPTCSPLRISSLADSAGLRRCTSSMADEIDMATSITAPKEAIRIPANKSSPTCRELTSLMLIRVSISVTLYPEIWASSPNTQAISPAAVTPPNVPSTDDTVFLVAPPTKYMVTAVVRATTSTAAKNGEHPRYKSGKNSHKMQQNVKISPKADRNPFLPPISHNRAKNRATSTYSAGER